MVQHHVTDWDFLVSRAEVNGKLVFVDDGKITVKAPDLSADPILELAYGHNVHDFEAGMDARDQFVTVKAVRGILRIRKLLKVKQKNHRLMNRGIF